MIEEKIILAKIFELPQSPTVILPHWCLFLVLLSDPIYLFSILTTYITTDGIEDCGEQLPYKDIYGLLILFSGNTMFVLWSKHSGAFFVAYCTHPPLEIEKSFSFASHSTVPTTNFFPVLSTPPYCPFHFWQHGDFFGFFFSPSNSGDNTPSASRHSGQKKNRTISLRSKPIWCFPFPQIFN